MKIADVMTKEVVKVEHSTKVIDVCRIMGERKIGSVVVTKDGKPYGIFTERDLLSKVLTGGSLEDEVYKYSSTPLVVVSKDYDVREAAKIMKEMNIRRLVVIENEEVVGIFTASDLVRLLGEGRI
ncbi:MAG: CBS domain-containing protein [Archaeoglobaceae archaeon]